MCVCVCFTRFKYAVKVVSYFEVKLPRLKSSSWVTKPKLSVFLQTLSSDRQVEDICGPVPLWVRSRSAHGPFTVRSRSALLPLMARSFPTHGQVKTFFANTERILFVTGPWPNATARVKFLSTIKSSWPALDWNVNIATCSVNRTCDCNVRVNCLTRTG